MWAFEARMQESEGRIVDQVVARLHPEVSAHGVGTKRIMALQSSRYRIIALHFEPWYCHITSLSLILLLPLSLCFHFFQSFLPFSFPSNLSHLFFPF